MTLYRFGFQRLLPNLAPEGRSGGGGDVTTGGGASPSGPATSPPPSGPSGDSLGSFRGESGAPGASPGTSPTPSPSGTPGAPDASNAAYDFLGDVFGTPTTSLAAPTPAPASPGAAEPQLAPAPAQQVPQPEAQPTAAPQAAQAQPGQVQQPQQGTQVPSQAGPSASYDPADPVSLARGLVENYAAAVDHLAERFALSPQDLEALETDVGGQIPRILARHAVYMQAQFLTQLGNIVPKMIERQQEVQTRHATNVDAFYRAWPSIDRVKHDPVVREVARTFRQMNPQMPTEQMIEAIGPYVLMKLGLPLTAMTRPGAAQSARATPRGNGATHFQPAAPGAVSVHQSPVDDPFGYMGARE